MSSQRSEDALWQEMRMSVPNARARPVPPLRAGTAAVPLFSIACLSRVVLALLVLMSSLRATAGHIQKGSVRIPGGPVQASIPLRIDQPLQPGSRIRVFLPDAGLNATLVTPEGERISPPTVLTQTFAVEEPEPPANAKTKPGRELVFRALTTLPSGVYRVEMEGVASKRSNARAAYTQYRPPKVKHQDSSCDFLCLGLGDTPMIILTSPIWVPIVSWFVVDQSIRGFVETRRTNRLVPTNAAVSATPIPSDKSRGNPHEVDVGDPLVISGSVFPGKVRRFDVVEIRAERVNSPAHLPGKDVESAAPASAGALIPVRRTSNAGFRGIYRPPAPGDYRFHIRAQGEHISGKRFSLQGSSTPLMRVTAPAVSFLSMAESLVDADANGRPEAWRVHTRVRVYKPGNYLVRMPAMRKDAPGECEVSQTLSLAAGEQDIFLSLSGDLVRACTPDLGRPALGPVRVKPEQLGQSRVAFDRPPAQVRVRDLRAVQWESGPGTPELQ